MTFEKNIAHDRSNYKLVFKNVSAPTPATPHESSSANSEQEQTIECASGLNKTAEGSAGSSVQTPTAGGSGIQAVSGSGSTDHTPVAGSEQAKSSGTTPITTVIITPGLEISK